FHIPSKEINTLAYNSRIKILYARTKDAGLIEIALDPQIKFREVKGKNILGFARTETTSAVVYHDGISIKTADREKNVTLLDLKKWQENYVSTTPLPLPKHRDDSYELNYATRAQEMRVYDVQVSDNIYWINTNIGLFAINKVGFVQRYVPGHSEEINFTPRGKLIE